MKRVAQWEFPAAFNQDYPNININQWGGDADKGIAEIEHFYLHRGWRLV